jgi:methyl-accepting chemotaxis protein
MKKCGISISRKLLIFNTLVVAIVVFVTVNVCVYQFKGEIERQATDAQEKRIKIFWELLKQKGAEMKVVDGKLMAGDYVINGNYELPDKLKVLSGGVATIFMGDERVSTNVILNGARAVGTKLTGPAHDSIFKQGKPFYGETEILKEKYFTAYEPITNKAGNVIGILFVGAKQSEFLDTMISISLPIFFISIGLFLVTGLFSQIVIRKILQPLRDTAALTARIAEGDLSVRIESGGNDEIGQVLNSMERMVSNLKQLMGDIKSSADEIASEARQLKSSSDKISVNINAETAQTNQIATSAEQMSQTVIDIAKNTSNIAVSSSEAAKTARNGEEVVNRSINETQKIAAAVSESSGMMIVLGEKSKEIGAIVEVINDIADQTNLLALNAAIEAARAGEQGRGFAVVADEVRKLAERTAKSTAQISEMIGAIQAEIDKAVNSMQGASRRVETGVTLSQEAGTALSAIVHNVNDLQGMVQQIASATEEMSSVSEHISGDIHSIAGGTRGVSTDVTNIVQATSDMEQLATKLQGFVAKFRV